MRPVILWVELTWTSPQLLHPPKDIFYKGQDGLRVPATPMGRHPPKAKNELSLHNPSCHSYLYSERKQIVRIPIPNLRPQ